MWAPAQTGEYSDVSRFAAPGYYSDDEEEQPLRYQPSRRTRTCRAWPFVAMLAAVALLIAGVACFYAMRPRSVGDPAHREPATSAISLEASVADHPATLAVAAFGVARGGSNATSHATPMSPEAARLIPNVDLHDGNVCEETEEVFGGLCYNKCSILTAGEAPIRTSPWTCCESHPCGLTNQRGRLGTTILCKGYDVDGSGKCPHKPGACLKNEEVFLGVCYKRCGILTKDEYPNRVGPATCCKANGLTCLDVFYHDKTRAGFAVGGGKGDHDASTPALPHPPQVRFTEDGDAAQVSHEVDEGSDAFDVVAMPVNHLHDGNSCEDREERFGGLCYKKCSLLTGGQNPIRTSPWTCCKSHPCGLTNQKGTLGHEILCDGYDVSADGSCPHKPGACLDDEELLMGMCYKKCSILTSGKFTHRVTPVSCCTATGVDCFDITKVRNRLTYAVGGGKGDHDPSTPAFFHTPEVSLTESAEQQQPRDESMKRLQR